MSGISFRIQAPPRPPTASAASTQPPSRSTSRAASARTGDDDNDSSDSETRQDVGRSGRQTGGDNSRRKRARLLGEGDEEVVEFGADGARTKHVKAPTGPLVIAALPNKDWRKAAEELRAGRTSGRRKQLYIPEAAGGGMSMQRGDSARAEPTPANVDAINTEEVVGGLSARPALPPSGRTEEAVEQVRQEVAAVGVSTPGASEASLAPSHAEDLTAPPPAPPQALTEEQRALRELLGHEAAASAEQGPEAILSAPDDRGGPLDETEAFKRDLETRPDEASLDDYARVPVGQFGMAMLRGMGWQPGQAASRTGRGAIEAHVPSSRPSLLGIGAKPMTEALGTGDDAKGRLGGKKPARTSKRDDMRFVPLMKRERDTEGAERRGGSADSPRRGLESGSASSSRRPSRSPPPRESSSSRHSSRRPSPSSSSYRAYSSRDERDRRRHEDGHESRHASREDDRTSRRSRGADDERRSSRRGDGDERYHRRRGDDSGSVRSSYSARETGPKGDGGSSSRSSRLREDDPRSAWSGSQGGSRGRDR